MHFKGKYEGILCLWYGSKLNDRILISNANSCSILFSSTISLEIFIVTNVYDPTTYVGRRVLWSSLNEMREAFLGISLFVARDFNFPLTPSKNKGGVEGFRDGMNEFMQFVSRNNLMYLVLKRFKFTWTNGRRGIANIQTKLDQILLSQDCILNFG